MHPDHASPLGSGARGDGKPDALRLSSGRSFVLRAGDGVLEMACWRWEWHAPNLCGFIRSAINGSNITESLSKVGGRSVAGKAIRSVKGPRVMIRGGSHRGWDGSPHSPPMGAGMRSAEISKYEQCSVRLVSLDPLEQGLKLSLQPRLGSNLGLITTLPDSAIDSSP